MFPLPIKHLQRTVPEDFIPSVSDPHGQGDRMWKIMSLLKITQGPLSGKTLGEVAPSWQEKWIRTLYGATNDDGSRIFDEAFLLISKKQGKSTLSGMIAIAHTLAFPTQRGSIIILADSKEQAGLVYDSMASTVEADPYLMEQFHVRRYRADIIHRATQTYLKAVATDYAAVVGQIPSFFIVDELHLLGLKPKGGKLVRQLSSGSAVHRDRLGIFISTAPIGTASGIYTSTLNRARRILSGESTDDKLLPVLFEIPPDTDPDNPKYWWMANPSLDFTVSRDWLIREHGIAKNDPDPAVYADFLSQHLNIAAQEVIGVDRWIPTDIWDAFADKRIDFERILEECYAIYVGMDAGYRQDPSALVVLGVAPDDTYMLWSHQWIHVDGYRKLFNHAEVQSFQKEGELTVGVAENEDIDGMHSYILAIHKTGKLVGCGVDPAKLQTLINKLEARGIPVTAVPQGWKMNPHLIETERLLYAGKINHFGGRMLRWNVVNGRLAERGQAKALVKPDSVSSTQKIDGLVCVVLAVAVATDPAMDLGLTGAGNLMVI